MKLCILKPDALAILHLYYYEQRSKSILINSEIIKLITPKTTHIANSKLIENDFNNKIPKNGPIAVPSTKLSENRLIPSLLRSTGVTCAAIVPVAVVAIAVAIPLIRRTNIKNVIDPGMK